MSAADIRQKIFEIIAGASPIDTPSYASASLGIIHKYERWTKDWNQFLALFKDAPSGRIFGFEITRSRSAAEKISNIEEEHTDGYTIKGYMSLNDAAQTDLIFDDKVEELRALFRGNHTLDGLCLDAGPVSIEIIEPRFFGDVLCHYAELKLPVTTIVT